MISQYVAAAAYEGMGDFGLRYERVSKLNTTAIIVDAPDRVYVAYAGTKPTSWGDIFDNFRFRRESYSGGKIHRGFLHHFSRVWEGVWSRVRLTDKPIEFVGHSLGGAAATIAALTMGACSTHEVHLTTFGSPRVGDASFSRQVTHYVHNINRFVNNSDFVTMLPPRPWYRHVGRLRYFNRRGELMPEVTTRQVLVDRILSRTRLFDGWHDHRIESYLIACHKNPEICGSISD